MIRQGDHMFVENKAVYAENDVLLVECHGAKKVRKLYNICDKVVLLTSVNIGETVEVALCEDISVIGKVTKRFAEL